MQTCGKPCGTGILPRKPVENHVDSVDYGGNSCDVYTSSGMRHNSVQIELLHPNDETGKNPGLLGALAAGWSPGADGWLKRSALWAPGPEKGRRGPIPDYDNRLVALEFVLKKSRISAILILYQYVRIGVSGA